MSILKRYQKAGGFNQLLDLLESSEPDKREKLLASIESEDKRWADALKEKTLSIEDVVDWHEDVLADVFANLSGLIIASAFHGFPEEYQQKVFAVLSRATQLQVEEAFEAKKPKESEIYQAFYKIIKNVRDLAQRGDLRLEDIAPQFAVDLGIEDRLSQSAAQAKNPLGSVQVKVSSAANPAPAAAPSVAATSNSVASGNEMAMQKMLTNLREENLQLKREIQDLKQSLEKIRKIVA